MLTNTKAKNLLGRKGIKYTYSKKTLKLNN
jgi:hypothetical protein